MRVPLFVWFLVPTILIVGAGVWFLTKNPSILGDKADTGKPVAVSSPVEGTVDFDIVGREQIASGTSGSGYNSSPPSSGPHWPNPAKNGVYDDPLPDEQVIHNMEHGHVWLAYRPNKSGSPSEEGSPEANLKPGVSEEEISKLKELVNDDDWKVIMTPRAKNETKIALVAWGRVLKMDEVDYNKIEDFIRTYRNRGPEKTPE